jgi:hypothetical protein
VSGFRNPLSESGHPSSVPRLAGGSLHCPLSDTRVQHRTIRNGQDGASPLLTDSFFKHSNAVDWLVAELLRVREMDIACPEFKRQKGRQAVLIVIVVVVVAAVAVGVSRLRPAAPSVEDSIQVIEGVREGDTVILSDMSRWDKTDPVRLE